MSELKIVSVVGARPNFMKIAPFIKAVQKHNRSFPDNNILHTLVHTGQHYDVRMSETFFKELAIPNPDVNLEVGSGSHAEQLGNTMIVFEKAMLEHKPDWIVVVGDVNATLSCSVVAKRLNINLCHIEAGLRSGDMSMPEEINRLVTDRLSDLLLTPDRISSQNLRLEGTPEYKIVFVGNIMIDTLESNRTKSKGRKLMDIIEQNLCSDYKYSGIIPKDQQYALMTLHRPSNVDHLSIFEPLINFLLNEVTRERHLIWPIHPRARKQLQQFGLWEKVIKNQNVIMLEPIGYHDMLRLNMGAQLMLTDSGGLQEECCVLGTPCLTLRWNTERPITLRQNGGVGILVGNSVTRIRQEYHDILRLNRTPQRPELWDGNAATRCLEAILNYSSENY